MSRMSVRRSIANSPATMPLSHDLPLTKEQVLSNLDLIAANGLLYYVDLEASLALPGISWRYGEPALDHGFHFSGWPYVQCPECVRRVLQ
jgi:hypothetical protein